MNPFALWCLLWSPVIDAIHDREVEAQKPKADDPNQKPWKCLTAEEKWLRWLRNGG